MPSAILSYLPAVHEALFSFATSDNFWSHWQIVFGLCYNPQRAEQFRQSWRNENFHDFPLIELLKGQELGTAQGAFSSETNKIYLSNSFFSKATPKAIVNVILEEYGHYVDSQINLVDSPGDEGAIFAALVQGKLLNDETLTRLRKENDHTWIKVGDDITQVEQVNLSGTNENDKLTGTEEDDVIDGLAGNDALSGLGGNDSLNGGIGNDTLYSDKGSDTINGATGFDYFRGDYSDRSSGLTMTYEPVSGNGTIIIGSEVDTLISIESFNTGYMLSGGFTGTNFNDVIIGTADSESLGGIYGLYGLAGDDTISCGAGDDMVMGGEGDDVVNGDSGNDELKGEDGNDRLQGSNHGKGEQDTLDGGRGNDHFILADATRSFYEDENINSAGEYDYSTIIDFNISEDLIQLRGSSNDYLLRAEGANSKLYINKPGNQPDELISIINNNTSLSLTASYFNYVSIPVLPYVTLTVSPTSVMEDGTTNLTYTFTRSGSTNSPLSVIYNITGSAIANDYSGATPGAGKTISFPTNSSTATLIIDPIADTTIENNETVTLTLTSSPGYTIGTNAAVTGTITNDDVPAISLSVANASVFEDGPTNIVYTFTRTGPLTLPLSVNYNIAGTATVDDYTGPTPGAKTVLFAANSATASITFDPLFDTIVEPMETLSLAIALGNGYRSNTTTPVVSTILNDDVASAIAYTLVGSQSNLQLLGTRRIYGIGNALNNRITGNSNNNRLYGLSGSDVLTGGGASDADVYAYDSLSDSLLGMGASFDQITDFNANDRFMAPLSVETDRLTSSLGHAHSLTAASIAGVLTTSSFLANSVAAFTSPNFMGTFVAMNDGRAGYQTETDAIVLLRNYTISGSNFVDFV
ncbi:MAG: bluetail domain-containing putative surface protein [Cyanobacteriota bacterium]|nr:bluetail domain-containing putative surface protein [Cyanobacteriota bacterium]